MTPASDEASGLAPTTDRSLPNLAGSSRSKRWAWVCVGLGFCALWALGRIVPSESAAPTPAESTATLRLQAPRIEIPADEPATFAAAANAPRIAPAPPAAEANAPPNPFAQAWEAELQKRALEASDERRRLLERQRHSAVVVFDDSKNRAGSPTARASHAPSSDPSAAAGLDPFQNARAERVSFGGDSQGGGFGFSTSERPTREDTFAREALEPVETIHAQRIEHPSTVVPQGTLIRGILETAIQSDLPGMVRAQVTEPVYAFDGTPAVPRGATLIGKYQSGLVQGQTRVFVIWTRLLRPDGVSIQLASPGTDLLGRTGVGGNVDAHFFERFRSSIVLSLLDGGLAIAAARAQNSDGATIIQGGGQGLQNAVDIALQNSVDIPPTIEVARGTPVQVFVAQDLDFVETIRRDPLERGSQE